MPTTLPERRKLSKIAVWARDGEIAVLLAAFCHDEAQPRTQEKISRGNNVRAKNERRRRSAYALDGMS